MKNYLVTLSNPLVGETAPKVLRQSASQDLEHQG
jgi:hypothetical protein